MSQDSISPVSPSREPWPSTKALSVYNVLRLNKRALMLLADVHDYLRSEWDPKYPQSWTLQGAEWLAEKGFVALDASGVIAATNVANDGTPRRLVRHNDDSDLRFEQ